MASLAKEQLLRVGKEKQVDPTRISPFGPLIVKLGSILAANAADCADFADSADS
jgi:hypothetical protein